MEILKKTNKLIIVLFLSIVVCPLYAINFNDIKSKLCMYQTQYNLEEIVKEIRTSNKQTLSLNAILKSNNTSAKEAVIPFAKKLGNNRVQKNDSRFVAVATLFISYYGLKANAEKLSIDQVAQKFDISRNIVKGRIQILQKDLDNYFENALKDKQSYESIFPFIEYHLHNHQYLQKLQYIEDISLGELEKLIHLEEGFSEFSFAQDSSQIGTVIKFAADQGSDTLRESMAKTISFIYENSSTIKISKRNYELFFKLFNRKSSLEKITFASLAKEHGISTVRARQLYSKAQRSFASEFYKLSE